MTVFNSIGVLGAGTMGVSIAARIAAEGRSVVLVDTKPEFIDRALVEIRRMLDSDEMRSKRSYPESTDEILSRIVGTCDATPLRELQFVAECINEDIDAKHAALKYLGELCRDTCVFGTSVTSVTVSELSHDLPCADRIVGFHLFSHANRLPFVELAASEKTSRRALIAAKRIAEVMGAVAAECHDQAGYMVKRMRSALFAESVRVLNEGKANISTIDAAISKAFGITGPFAEMNDVGIQTAEFAAKGLSGNLPDLYIPPERLRAQSLSGEKWNILGDIDSEKQSSLEDRFIGLMLSVSTALLDEECATAEDINWATKFGLGFSEGIFDIFNRLGFDRAKQLVQEFASSRNTAVPESLNSFSSKTGFWPLSYVKTEIEEDTAWVTVCRPDTKNALDETLTAQFDTVVKRLEKNEQIRTVVFSGMGETLLSGPPKQFFLDKLAKNDVAGIIALLNKIHVLFSRVADSKKLTIARPRGLTSEAGYEFALSCKYLIAYPRSTFVFLETGIGIHPAMGATQRLPRKVGKSIGKYLIMTGDMLVAEAAERLGVADAILDDDDALAVLTKNLQAGESLSDDEIGPSEEELQIIALFNGNQCAATLKREFSADNSTAQKVGNALASKAPCALSLVNKLIDDGLGMELSKALKVELAAFGLVLGTKDAVTGLSSDGNTVTFIGE